MFKFLIFDLLLFLCFNFDLYFCGFDRRGDFIFERTEFGGIHI